MTDRIQNYYTKIDKKNGETATKERLTIKEWDKKEMERKREEVREWHRQDTVMKGLNKSIVDKRKMVPVE